MRAVTVGTFSEEDDQRLFRLAKALCEGSNSPTGEGEENKGDGGGEGGADLSLHCGAWSLLLLLFRLFFDAAPAVLQRTSHLGFFSVVLFSDMWAQ